MTTFDFVADWWTYAQAHPDAFIVGGLAVTVLILVLRSVIRRVVRGGRPDKWLSVVSLMIGMGWSAEAMWEIATQQLRLATSFALLVFFVFETQLGVAMIRTERHQRVHQNPGRYGRTAWLIALVMGCIAAMAGDTWVERALRLAVPLLVTKQWWDGLTGDGITKSEDAITWTWTPRRILVALNLARPGQQDLTTADRHRQVFALAKVSHRLHSTRWGWRRAWCEMRLRQLSMKADDAMLDEARTHVERVWRSTDRTRPLDADDLAVIAMAKAEVETCRVEAAEARAAHDTAVEEVHRLERVADQLRQELAKACELQGVLEERARSAEETALAERRDRETAQQQLMAELRTRTAAVRRAQAQPRQVRRAERLSAGRGDGTASGEMSSEESRRLGRLAGVQKIVAKHPTMSPAELDLLIAAEFGCSERTARRWRGDLKAEQADPEVAGFADSELEADDAARPLAKSAA